MGVVETNETNAIQTAINAGAQMVDVSRRVMGTGDQDIPLGLIYGADGSEKLQVLKEVLEVDDARAPQPKRRKGTSVHHELTSFIAHVNRFKDEGSAIFADIDSVNLLALLNYHSPGAQGDPRWGDHRSVYACPLSRPWKLWVSMHETSFTQDAFGEWIDNNMGDLASSPELEEGIASPAAVLQMARNLVVRTKGEFSRAINPTTGEGSLVSKLENESLSTTIPRAFLLKLPVFEGGELYRVEARVRFAMRDGKPSFAYSLYQIDDVKRDAFASVRKAAADGTGLLVFAGKPE